jgi:small subunit ribosomal protein S8
MITDPIADYLTRIRNAIRAKHRIVEIPASNLKKAMTTLLYEKGYIQQYEFEDQPNRQGLIKIRLKQHPSTNANINKPPITLIRESKPSRRKYVKAKQLPRVLNGLGIAILSTPKGIISDKEARQLNVGGEVLCYIY